VLNAVTRFHYVAISGILVFAAAFLWFVWPTQYRYDRLGGSGPSSAPVRIDRLTGRAEILTWEGWKPLGHSEPTAHEDVPPSELARLDGQCKITSIGNDQIACDIYNGSTWKLEEITINITVSGLSRDYKFSAFIGNGSRLENTTFQAILGFAVTNQPWSWHIVRARGVRE
jgi:hypothetical protein